MENNKNSKSSEVGPPSNGMKTFLIILISLIAITASSLWYFSDTVTASIAKIKTSLTKTTIKSANNTGLVAYWNFDDCDTCSTANDLSGNRRTGTMYNAAGPTVGNLHTVAGRKGNGIYLDGSNDYVDTGQDTPFDFTGSFSISAWVKSSVAAQNTRVVIWKTSSYGIGYDLDAAVYGGSANDDRFVFIVTADGGSNWKTARMSTTATVDRWYHLVGVFDYTNALTNLYVDGALEHSVSSPIGSVSNSAYNLHIGNYDFAPDAGYFNGFVDEARIYNRALSAAEVKTLYISGNSKFIVNKPPVNIVNDGLIGHWSLDGQSIDWTQSSAEVRDTSKAANHGNAVNMGTSNAYVGAVGQALDFDGVAEYIDLADAPFDMASSFSMSIWARVPGPSPTAACASTQGPSCHLLAWKYASYGICYGCTYPSLPGNANQFGFFISKTVPWGVVNQNEDVVPGRWYHLVGVFDDAANQMYFYVDGQLKSSAAFTTTARNSAYNLRISSYDSDPDGGYFKGQLDEVRMYNRALSAAEVKELYRAGR